MRSYAFLSTAAYLRLRWAAYRLQRQNTFPERQPERLLETGSGYSFKPYDDTRSLFIHVPKCAGISICRALYANLAGGHTTLDDYLNIFEPGAIETYFKFTIVRNPWDRLVSAYHFLASGGFSAADKAWFGRNLGHFSSFEEFVERWLNRDNIWKYHHFKPQTHFIVDRHRKVALDFVALFENLERDIEVILDNVNPTAAGVVETTNASSHAGYEAYYNDRTRRLVAEVYADDIDRLGYSFDNSSLPAQLARRSPPTGIRSRRATGARPWPSKIWQSKTWPSKIWP